MALMDIHGNVSQAASTIVAVFLEINFPRLQCHFMIFSRLMLAVCFVTGFCTSLHDFGLHTGIRRLGTLLQVFQELDLRRTGDLSFRKELSFVA